MQSALSAATALILLYPQHTVTDSLFASCCCCSPSRLILPILFLATGAFEKLSDTKWGVVATTWRDVPCWHRPQKWARVPSWKKATAGQKPPAGFRRSQDGRPAAWYDFGHRKAL